MFRQRCACRQCNRLNPRVRRKEALARYHNAGPIHEELLDQRLSQQPELPLLDMSREDDISDVVPRKEITDDNRNGITEIIDDILAAVVGDKDKAEVKTVEPRAKQYKCDVCGRAFAQFASAVKHCTVKKSPDKGAVCPICGKKVILKRNLKRHIDLLHNNPKGDRKEKQIEASMIKCAQCGKVYSSKNKLVEHLHSKHGVARKEAPMIKCSKCDFSHTSDSRVKAHFTLKHSSVVNFDCSNCDAQFRSKSGLQKHLYRVHKSGPSDKIIPSAPVVATRSVPLSNYIPDISVSSNYPVQHLPIVSHLQSANSGQNQLPDVISRQSHFQVGVSRQNLGAIGVSGQTGIWGQNSLQVGLSGYQFPAISEIELSGQNNLSGFYQQIPSQFTGQNHPHKILVQNSPSPFLRQNPLPEILRQNPPPEILRQNPLSSEFLLENSGLALINPPPHYISTHNTIPQSLPEDSLGLVNYQSESIITDSGSTYQSL